jgi:penicillin-binding protein 1B
MAGTAKKKPVRRKKTAKKGSKPAGRRWLFPGRVWLKLLFVGCVVVALGLIYLDARVKHKFAGKKWALPALVYARPLELYPGLELSSWDFEQELRGLGYQFGSTVNIPGSVSRQGHGYRLHTRGFRFWDGEEPPRKIHLGFSNGRVSDLRDQDGSSLNLLRLEPLHIGGIYPRHNEDRILVRLQDVPQQLIDGLISVEDREFYQHWGLSPRSIARAFVANLRSGAVVQGGSTLTQQLVKNFFLTRERSITRKLTEAVMSILLELHFSKQEILEAYLNEVYLGQDGHRAIHGFGLASQYYFKRPLGELETHQVALLVALVKGPSWYDPWRYPQRARDRRNLVLEILSQEGVLSEDEALFASVQGLGIVAKRGAGSSVYPAYLDLVRRQLRRDYSDEDLSSQGLRIFTALDPRVQRQAELSLQRTIGELEKWHGLAAAKPPLEGAVIVAQVDSGEVQAVVGGRNPHYAGFNRALDAVRPVGSLIKPAVYLTALQQSHTYNLASLLDDAEISIRQPGKPDWQPRNYDRKSHGLVPMHRALSRSYNQSTARLGMELGLEDVATTVSRLGVSRNVPRVPAMLLGSVELSPLEVATMYQTIAARGFSTPLRAIREVLDSDGRPLSRYPYKVEQLFSPDAMHLLHYALQEVTREGTGKGVYRKLPASFAVAGKTGTTNELRDSWFAGFSGDLLAVTWLGRDDNSATPFTGASGALRVWADVMAGASRQPLEYRPPESIIHLWVDEATGMRSEEGCLGARYLPFIKGSEPLHSVACTGRQRGLGDWLKSLVE